MNWNFSRAEVAKWCLQYGPALRLDGITDDQGNALDPVLVMRAFALNESYHNADGTLGCPPRFEKAYWEGKYSLSPFQKELNEKYGKAGASSYGNWQVMLCNCGFAPQEFAQCEIGALAFIGIMNRLIKSQKPKTIRELADAYNSGNCNDMNVPLDYMNRLVKNYAVPMIVPGT